MSFHKLLFSYVSLDKVIFVDIIFATEIIRLKKLYMAQTTPLGKRIKLLRKSQHLTQGELANKIGLDGSTIAARTTISHYENGRRKPSHQELLQLAEIFNVTVDWLLQTDDIDAIPENLAKCSSKPIPLYELEAITSFEFLNNPHTEIITFDGQIEGQCFAVRISGDSMLSEHGISFPTGTIVIFDTKKPPKHGSFVLVIDNQHANFKQLSIDAGEHYLQPLNKNFPIKPLDKKAKIMATAIRSISIQDLP